MDITTTFKTTTEQPLNSLSQWAFWPCVFIHRVHLVIWCYYISPHLTQLLANFFKHSEFGYVLVHKHMHVYFLKTYTEDVNFLLFSFLHYVKLEKKIALF